MTRTIDSILETFNEWVENKNPIDSHQWVKAAQYLNVLISDEHDKLFKLQQQVATLKCKLIEEKGISVARAELEAETTDICLEERKQKAKIKQIEEFIRIAKLQSRLKDNEYAGQ